MAWYNKKDVEGGIGYAVQENAERDDFQGYAGQML